MRTLHEIDVKDKRILVRVDANAPIKDGEVTDDNRLRESLPTLKYLLDNGAKQIILLAHQGRPKDHEKDLMLDPQAKKFAELLGEKVVKLDDAGETTPPEDAKVVLLENLRFYDEKAKEHDKREAFAKKLAQFGDVYINDAFGTSHRDHASITALPRMMPESAAGLLLEKEIKSLTPLLKDYKKPLVLVMGGAKIDTKIGVLKNYVDKAGTFLIGGGLANTLLYAQGYEVGESLCEEDKMEIAQDIMLAAEKNKENVLLPTDVVVADEVEESATGIDLPVEDVTPGMHILDIGKNTITEFKKAIEHAGTIIWNGPMGFSEIKQFANGTKEIGEAIAGSNAYTVIGGGDTIEACKRLSIELERFDHVSTGGGAMIEFLEGRDLPGIAVLRSK